MSGAVSGEMKVSINTVSLDGAMLTSLALESFKRMGQGREGIALDIFLSGFFVPRFFTRELK